MPTIDSASFRIICEFTIVPERNAVFVRARSKEFPSVTAAPSIVLRARNEQIAVGSLSFRRYPLAHGRKQRLKFFAVALM
jgi:hypothetical protein